MPPPDKGKHRPKAKGSARDGFGAKGRPPSGARRPLGAEKGPRRALANVGGEVELTGGDEIERTAALHALDVHAEEGTRDHVHGFHSYPARLHALTARRFVERLSPASGVVLDPFCGSGTVLVEGRLAGRKVIGVDANPLAIELAWLKTRGASESDLQLLLESAHAVTAVAHERREQRAGSSRRYGREDAELFEPHVLMELDGLTAGLAAVRNNFARGALWLVFSAILIKVSRRTGDSSEEEVPRRIAAGYTSKLFLRKAEELSRLLAEFTSLLPNGAPAARAMLGDAREIEGVTDASVDLVLSSPPYPGNYDYLSHHAVRLRWLGLDADRFDALEVGARRHLTRLPDAAAEARWTADLGRVLSACRRVLAPRGRVILVMADSVIGQRAIFADDSVRATAPRAGLEVSLVASQARPYFHGPTARLFDRRPRREHAIVCRLLSGG